MRTIKNILKYNALTSRKAVLILFAVMAGIGILTKPLSISFNSSSSVDNSFFNGFEITFAIFLFVAFIASFSSDFNHLNVLGVTRKAFYKGNLLFSVVASAFMLVLMAILTGIYFILGINVKTLVMTAYNTDSIIVFIAFSLSLFVLSSMFGWFLSLLGYRFGTPMIIALAVSPAVLFTIVPYIAYKFGLDGPLQNVFKFYFGRLNGVSPLLATINFLATAALFALANWLLIRKLPVKMQQ